MTLIARHQDTAGRGRISVDLPVAGRKVVVAGTTGQAVATTSALLRADAQVTVLCHAPTPLLVDLASRGLITLHERNVTESDIAAAAIVFAHTGFRGEDIRIDLAAAQLGVLCVSDGPQEAQRSSRVVEAPGPPAGRVILVGGGPGSPGLLTVAGRDAIATADVIVVDRLAPVSAIAEWAPHAEVVDASKIPGGRRMEQSRINAVLISHALAGKTVVRLKGGDGFVFGRGGEELDECVRAGIPVDVIPGVSSSIAAPASAMIPVTHRGLTQGFTVVSGHVPPEHPESTVNYAALAQANTSIVLMMAVANLDAISRALIDGGMDADTPAAVIADGSLPSQREIRAPLRAIAAAARAAEIGPPATTVIGAVAGFVPGVATVSRARVNT